MKNQFFGDIRDYRKYGLLRALAPDKEAWAALCWMLTPDEAGPKGKRIGYLRRPKQWRRFDPELFDALRQAVVVDGQRNVARAETSSILNPQIFSFHKKLLSDNIDDRRKYFQEFLSEKADGRPLVFFDPDNGLEVKSVPPGRRGSSKHLYLEELSMTYDKGHSIVVFQFFMFKKPQEAIDERTCQIFSRLSVEEIASFKTPSVIYFLVPRPEHLDELKHRSEQVRKAWGGQIQPAWHVRTGYDRCVEE
jgi:hypothetical protein